MDNELLNRGFVPRPLTPAQSGTLDANGFVILEDIIAPDWLAGLRHAFDEIFDSGGRQSRR